MKVKIYRQQDINKAYQQGRKDAIRLCMDSIMAIITLKLHDEHGMDADELRLLESEVNKEFDAVCDNRVSLDEIAEAKREEIK